MSRKLEMFSRLDGMIVKSISGHDEGRFYLVIAESPKGLVLVDGKYRSMSQPKTKNRKHIKVITGQVFSSEHISSLSLKVTSGEADRVIRDLIHKTEEDMHV